MFWTLDAWMTRNDAGCDLSTTRVLSRSNRFNEAWNSVKISSVITVNRQQICHSHVPCLKMSGTTSKWSVNENNWVRFCDGNVPWGFPSVESEFDSVAFDNSEIVCNLLRWSRDVLILDASFELCDKMSMRTRYTRHNVRVKLFSNKKFFFATEKLFYLKIALRIHYVACTLRLVYIATTNLHRNEIRLNMKLGNFYELVLFVILFVLRIILIGNVCLWDQQKEPL